jgi:hypothetical protein
MVKIPQDASLRLKQFAITNYRTFRERVVLDFSTDGHADRMPVFHGDNGAGKSNAFAALDLFFRTSRLWLTSNVGRTNEDYQLQYTSSLTPSGQAGQWFEISPWDWHPGVRDPIQLEATFEDPRLPALRVTLTQAGATVALQLEREWASAGSPRTLAYYKFEPDEITPLLNVLATPKGVGSRPISWLDARRRERDPVEQTSATEAPNSPLSSSLVERLASLTTSRDPKDALRWRSYLGMLQRFRTLKGYKTSVVHLTKSGNRSGVSELRFEEEGRSILSHTELSSGEQQIVALCAEVLTSRAAIVVIEEPELSLSLDNQELLRVLLEEQAASGLIDQLILESHSQTFDSAQVLRFERIGGVTSVARAPAAGPQAEELEKIAKEKGAEKQWVTAGGYTQLPAEMLTDLQIKSSGYVWFLPSEGERRWQAYRSQELDDLLTPVPANSKPRRSKKK